VVTSLSVGLRFDMRAPAFGTPPARLYDAALELAEWADVAGFDYVRVSEHHGSADGYCPSPLTLLAAMAGRTRRISLRARVLILPLHDPVRVAEDAAVVDLLSDGRLEMVVAGGYVPAEFAMFGRDMESRARDVEDGVAVLRAAWSGDRFDYRGRRGRLGILPSRKGGPPLALGGSSSAAARRAARLGLGFEPTDAGLFREYAEECLRLGSAPGEPPRQSLPGGFLHVTRDPEQAWQLLGPHILHEVRSYARLLRGGGAVSRLLTMEDSIIDDEAIAAIRASGRYHLLTPDESVERVRALPGPALVEFSPVMAGLDPEEGLRSLELFASEVWPRLRARAQGVG
jgi:alkanesulfonate monooxygenase SsuD/methylene tetrahydromethanopterin reductase-like flavin-dependent oxidoreductase (luciferase family)